MLACLILAASVGIASAATGSFSYPESELNGWTDTCVDGEYQSPVDLPTNMKAEVHAPINYRNYFNGHFNKHFKGTLRNTGTSVQWNINHLDNNQLYGGAMWRWKNPSIRDGPYGGKTHTHAYYLWQLHFHWGEPGKTDKGSEHTVDGKMYPMEMHMVHVEDRFIGKKGYVKVGEAIESKHGLAVLGIFFHIDNNKPQNQEPMSEMDDKVWEMHWPGAHSGKRSANPLYDASMDLDEVEEKQMEYDHSLNVRSLSYGFSKLGLTNNHIETRSPHQTSTDSIKLTLNIGAFIRKAVRNGADKTMSTYWSYKGSLTTPGCSEAVTWVVFHRTLPIAQVQANAFASLYSNNYRESRPALPKQDLKYLIHDCLACNCKCN